MLDYSDDEERAESVAMIRKPLDLRGGSAVSKCTQFASFEAQSIFKSFRDRTSRLIMPEDKLGVTHGFEIGKFRARKALLGSKNQHLGIDLKGKYPVFDKVVTDKFSSDYDDHPDSFFKSMKTIVLLAQIFAVMPTSGALGPNYKSLSFRWIHYKTMYWALALLGAFFCFVCTIIHGLKKGVLTEFASKIIYFSCGVFSSLLMLNLGRNWRKINKEFAQMEQKMKKYGYPKGIKLKFDIFSTIILFVALVEHLLSKTKNVKLASICARRKDFFSLAEAFFVHEYNEVFSMHPYNFWTALILLVSNFLTGANWNIKDLFLCLISWSIAERFQQVHGLLDSVHGQERPSSFWREVREEYNHLCVLTKRVDVHIQKLMLLSIGNNLFFICIQLLYSLKREINSVKIVYFIWSFGFLVLRTSLVAFSASKINDESKEPKTVLYSVPQQNYSAEVRRFLTQLTTSEVALTGSGFFSVTRSLILTITGTVITYEIVLVQFSGNDVENDLNNNKTYCLNLQ